MNQASLFKSFLKKFFPLFSGCNTPQERLERVSYGFTVLEVIVAIFIFGLVSALLVKSLGSADRIRGRAGLIMESIMIAQNEVERIRNTAAFKETVLDCTYVAISNKRQFDVERKIIAAEYGEIDNSDQFQEIELVIKGKDAPDSTAFRFRFLQGYTW